jgi:hypothetical protein
MLAKFIARAILETEKAKESAALANGLLNEPHRGERIQHIWGYYFYLFVLIDKTVLVI